MDQKKKTLYMIGNAHLDPVWLWRWQEGFQEVKATFRSVLDRMQEYPDFIFTSSSAAYYEWMEKNEPELFEEIRARVQEGRWVIDGGWWVQPDCNAPCGESFARQGLYGQRYFMEKLGVTAHTGYNVDSFGHSGMLPQILKKSGMDNYVFMRPGRHEKAVPGQTFQWRSKDGSGVAAFRIPFEYCTWPDEISLHVKRCAGEIRDDSSMGMCFYGVGNHGGGPTKKNLDSIREMDGQEGYPCLRLASPDGFFRDLKESGARLPELEGELFHHSSGCYSAHSRVKLLNRRAENRLLMAEKLSAAAGTVTGRGYPAEKLADAWKAVLFNQFHDIMAGTSIESAYQDAEEAFGFALHTAAERLNDAVQALSWRIHIPMEEGMKPVAVFNPNAFSGTFAVELESPALPENAVLVDEDGSQAPMQAIQSEAAALGRCRICFTADLPALGWRTFRIIKTEQPRAFPPVMSTDTMLENRWFRVEFDPETGYIRSFVRKDAGGELFSGPAARPVVIRDTSDTWSHAVRRFDGEIGAFRAVSVKCVERGPVCAVVRVTSVYGDSRLVQDFTAYHNLDMLVVRARVDWREKAAMLKLRFPMNLNYFRGSYEIPYGYAEREPDGEEYPMQTWADFEGAVPDSKEARCGLSILNDGMFACSADHKMVGLTVLRSPAYANHEPFVLRPDGEYSYLDQGARSFVYALYPHGGSWEDGKTVRHAASLNQGAVALFETYHEGPLAQSGSFLECGAENVLVTVFKQAEDGSGDFVIRAYETAGRRTNAVLRFAQMNRECTLSFAPYEIKTVRLPAAGGEPYEIGIPEL